jgi:glycine betaine/proline transport system substrate-binding protein
MKKPVLSLAFGIAAAFSAEKVNIGTPAWTGAQAIAALLQAVVVERIGGEANLVPGNNATIFQGMDQGKGDIDVHPDVWLPNQESFTKKYVDGAGTVVLRMPMKATRGFVSRRILPKRTVSPISPISVVPMWR